MSVSKNSLLRNFSVSSTLASLGPPIFNIRIPVFAFEFIELLLRDRTSLKTLWVICLVHRKCINLVPEIIVNIDNNGTNEYQLELEFD